MRDIILTMIVFGAIPFFFSNPVLGVYVWTWLGMMSPHRATYGFAANLPFAYVVAVVTIVSLIFSRKRKPLPLNSITITLMLLLAWMGVTSIFALNSADLVWEKVVFFGKIQIMLFVTFMLVRGRQDIERLIWVVALSVGYYGIKGGAFTILTGGSYRVYGPAGSLMEENNGLAIALVMIAPLYYYLAATAKIKIIRIALVVCLILICFSILGSHSRGALLALVCMAGLLGMKSKRPVYSMIFILVTLTVGVTFMPESWTSRMETIETYQDDASAMSRMYTWQTLWNLALDRPLVGAGFRADMPEIFARYAPFDGSLLFNNSGVLVAHSIYFQALGEHGFPGLILFVLLGLVSWRKASRLKLLTANDPEFGDWVPLLMPMIQVGILGFAVGGAFLSMMNFDIPYYIVGFVVIVDATVRDRMRQRAKTGGAQSVGLSVL